jgi:hypothetical protein
MDDLIVDNGCLGVSMVSMVLQDVYMMVNIILNV